MQALPIALQQNLDSIPSASLTPNASSSGGPKVLVGGYLLKKGLGLAVWKRRFFLFKDNQLEYRKEPKATELLGVIPLRRFDVSTPSQDSKDFEIHTPGRVYYLRAENLQSKVNWISALLAHQKRLIDFPTPFVPPQDPAAGSDTNTGVNGATPTSNAATAATPVPSQACVYCGGCKSTFNVSRERMWCIGCGFAFCSNADCFNVQNRVCVMCRTVGTVMGSLSSALAAVEAAKGGVATQASSSVGTSGKGSLAGKPIAPGGAVPAAPANLLVRVIEARDLRAADISTSRDPYAVLFVGDRRFQTKTCHRTLFPWWNEDFHFPLTGVSNRAGLQIAVFDEDKHTTDAFLGMVYLPIAMFRKDTHIDAWFTLQPRPSDSDSNTNAGGPTSPNSPDGENNGDLDATPTVHSSESAAAAASASRGWLGRKTGHDAVSGAIHLQIVYSYSPTTLLEYDENAVKADPPLSKKTLAANVRRVQRIIASLQISEWKESYREIMMWRKPFRTLFALVVYCFTVLYFPVRLVPAVPTLICLFYLCATYVDRRFNSHSFPLVYEPDDGSLWTDASIDALAAAEGEAVDEDDLISSALANALAPYAQDAEPGSVEAIAASTHAAVVARRRSAIPRGSRSPSQGPTPHKAQQSGFNTNNEVGRMRGLSIGSISEAGDDDENEYDYSHLDGQMTFDGNDESDEEDNVIDADSPGLLESIDNIPSMTRERGSSVISRARSDLEAESSVRSRRPSGPPPKVSVTTSPDSILANVPVAASDTSLLTKPAQLVRTKEQHFSSGSGEQRGERSDSEADSEPRGLLPSKADDQSASGAIEGRTRPLPARQIAYGLKGLSASLHTVGSSPHVEGQTTMSQQAPQGKRQKLVQFAKRLFGFRSSDDSQATSVSNSTSSSNPGEKKLGLIAQARKYQRSMQTIQNRMGDVCDVIEQIDAVLSWQDYRRSVLVLKVMLAITMVLILFPTRLVLLVAGLFQFTAFFRKRKGTKTKTLNVVERLVLSAPTEGDLNLTEDSLHPSLRKK